MFAGGANAKTARSAAALLPVLALCLSSYAVDISNRYRSPRNPERRIRESTELIVLHTTEAPARSSLNKVSERGECHFCVTEEGSVYSIVDRDREAFHAGRSMWNGREDVDKYSVGIECVGYHNKKMSDIQLNAIRDLVKELQAMYKIPDERVVCHSHVAYGAPNKWHKFKHRGRKRCGMLFAMPSVRRKLGLFRRPAFDPDTRAKRLRTADEYLRQVLYGSVDTMAPIYTVPLPKPQVRIAAPRPTKPQTSPVAAKPNVVIQTKPLIRAAPPPARPQIRVSAVQPKPRPTVPSQRAPTSIAQLKAQGYHVAGSVTVGMTALKIAGARWNATDTYYTIRDKVIPGNRIDASHIERGMQIWLKKR